MAVHAALERRRDRIVQFGEEEVPRCGGNVLLKGDGAVGRLTEPRLLMHKEQWYLQLDRQCNLVLECRRRGSLLLVASCELVQGVRFVPDVQNGTQCGWLWAGNAKGRLLRCVRPWAPVRFAIVEVDARPPVVHELDDNAAPMRGVVDARPDGGPFRHRHRHARLPARGKLAQAGALHREHDLCLPPALGAAARRLV